jgi:hypothetical protein
VLRSWRTAKGEDLALEVRLPELPIFIERDSVDEPNDRDIPTSRRPVRLAIPHHVRPTIGATAAHERELGDDGPGRSGPVNRRRPGETGAGCSAPEIKPAITVSSGPVQFKQAWRNPLLDLAPIGKTTHCG